MDIRINEEYYCNTCDYYAKQIEAIEGYLDDFKEQYQSLFANVEFGEHLGMVLIGKSDGFYNVAKECLSSLLNDVKVLTNDFLDEIDEDDILS